MWWRLVLVSNQVSPGPSPVASDGGSSVFTFPLIEDEAGDYNTRPVDLSLATG
jgi:hypothetical protein